MMEDLAMHMMEIIMNSIKANSTLIKISISFLTQTNKIMIEIIDNGCGFDVSRKSRSDSYGLIGMRERGYQEE